MTSTTPRPGSGLIRGIAVGLLAMLLSAAAYGAFSIATDMRLGFAAVGVGLLVGLAMAAARPFSPALPWLAAVFAVAGAVLGLLGGSAVLVVRGVEARGVAIGYAEAFTGMAERLPGIMIGEFKSVIAWMIAGVTAFGLVHRRVRSAHESHAASAPQPDEAPVVDYFKPHRPA
ncbi:hypothetical protein GCM10010466_59270 [Planomonospora alba]|uniref:Uncharacterized protein n=1 Tax=Planomonospora alba TaxID=161354 RepID=A0ABP6NXA5_9ACTN